MDHLGWPHGPVNGKLGVRPNQHGFMNEGMAVNVVCLDFSKAFGTLPHNILVERRLPTVWMGVRSAG